MTKLKEVNDIVKRGIGIASKYNLKLIVNIAQIDDEKHSPITISANEESSVVISDGIKQCLIGSMDEILNFVSLDARGEVIVDEKQQGKISSYLLSCLEKNEINIIFRGIFKKNSELSQECILDKDSFKFLSRSFKIDYRIIINTEGKTSRFIERTEKKPEPIVSSEILQKDFYIIPKDYLLHKISKPYRDFLKLSGYMDLDSADCLLIEKKIFNTEIDQLEGKKLVESQGYKLLTVGLMYLVFIPYIKDQAKSKNKEAQTTLKEMVKYGEWMEDSISNQDVLKIGSNEIQLKLPKNEGYFNSGDINYLGYPEVIKSSGEYHYRQRDFGSVITLRSNGSNLGLDLHWFSNNVHKRIGIRRVKIFKQ